MFLADYLTMYWEYLYILIHVWRKYLEGLTKLCNISQFIWRHDYSDWKVAIPSGLCVFSVDRMICSIVVYRHKENFGSFDTECRCLLHMVWKRSLSIDTVDNLNALTA